MNIAITGNSIPFGEGLAYGGERILYYLIQGLDQLGHDIYVYAHPGCNIPSKYIDGFYPVIQQEGTDKFFEAVQNSGKEIDIYQCNYFGENWSPKILDTYDYVELTWCVWNHISFQLNQPAFNTISYSKVLQNDFKDRGIDTTMIHYGIPEDLYKFEPNHEGYAVWIGKIEGGKAPQLAIQLALAAGLKIAILGPPYNTGTFWNHVLPYVDNEKVFWFRGVDDAIKQKIMSKAKVFISSNDNTWKEHFGIVNAEALAMGVPILAFNKINQDCAIKVDEIINDGQHGFFLNYNDSNDVQEILDKGIPLLNQIYKIDRMECRKQFETRFTALKMAQRYEWFYKQIKEKKIIPYVEVPF